MYYFTSEMHSLRVIIILSSPCSEPYAKSNKVRFGKNKKMRKCPMIEVDSYIVDKSLGTVGRLLLQEHSHRPK